MNAILIAAAAIAVRNPFWPIGYEGVRQPISAEPIVEVKPAANASDDDTATAAMAARSSQTVSSRHWIEARKTLRHLTRDSEDYAIIYLEENLAAELQPEIDRYKDSPSPAIILIPGREGPLGLGQSALVAAVERAVGADILRSPDEN